MAYLRLNKTEPRGQVQTRYQGQLHSELLEEEAVILITYFRRACVTSRLRMQLLPAFLGRTHGSDAGPAHFVLAKVWDG